MAWRWVTDVIGRPGLVVALTGLLATPALADQSGASFEHAARTVISLADPFLLREGEFTADRANCRIEVRRPFRPYLAEIRFAGLRPSTIVVAPGTGTLSGQVPVDHKGRGWCIRIEGNGGVVAREHNRTIDAQDRTVNETVERRALRLCHRSGANIRRTLDALTDIFARYCGPDARSG